MSSEPKPVVVTVQLDYQDAVTYLDDVNERILFITRMEAVENISNEQVNTREAYRRVRDMLMDALDSSRAQ